MSLTSRAPWFWSLRKDLSPWKESWATKNCCFWTVVLEKTLEKSLGLQGDSTSPKGNQSSIFIGRTDAEAETPILWPPGKNWLIGKDPDAGKEQAGEGDDRGWQRMRWLDGITSWLMSRNDTGNNCPGVRRISVVSWWQSQRWSQNPCGPLPRP